MRRCEHAWRWSRCCRQPTIRQLLLCLPCCPPASRQRPLLHPMQAADWYDIDKLPGLAFDHRLIVRTAFRHLAGRGAVVRQPGLAQQLEAAAGALEGPWQQQ